MKKVLLTTSALTLLASAAAADVSVGASGRLGVTNNGTTTSIENRMTITFSGSGTTDGGLTFGAWMRQRNTGATTTGNSASHAYISNGTMTLTFGNAWSAAFTAANPYGMSIGYRGQFSVGGLAGLSGSVGNTVSSNGAGTNLARLDMSLGSATVSLSNSTTGDAEIAVGAAMGGADLDLAYDFVNGNYWGSVSMSAGSANFVVMYGNVGGTNGYGVGVSGGLGSGTGSVIWANNGATTGYGVAYAQSLGGGATAAVSFANAAGTAMWDAGVSMSF